MKLYNFGKWNKEKHAIQLTEWETDEILFKKQFERIKKGWIVIDVGSEFGYYAIKAGRLVGSEGKVLAIEPFPETYQLLKMNIRLHKFVDHIVPICKAVGKQTGKAKLYETISPGGTSIVPRRSSFKLNKNRLLMWLEFAKKRTIFKIIRERYAPVRYVVPVDTLDRIAKEYSLEKIDLIKIDVEGAELDVLKGSRSILKRNKPILLVEVHFGCDWKPETLYQLLQKLGYSLTMEKRPHKALVIAHPGEKYARY